ncbi:MAG: Glycosyl transferase family protein [candidate division Zixibacteria bacterium RBG-1]|nr:MAG: Glycosyl transferase family protein [candidate division Zixibacteria bacterium RBG-1]OGC84805.1 MAG: hypothetical protein A2V73_05800 [candidate division Zixibacteria bacterium RBG_19FT_COMBO_42_43]
MTKPEKLIFFGLLFFQIVLGLVFVFFRFVDADEGLYLNSAYLVKQGQTPYYDFFYPQAPLLPFVFAPIADGGINSLFLGRLISLLISLILGLLLLFYYRRITTDSKSSLWLYFFYTFNGLFLVYHPVVKTYAWSDLFGFLSFIFLSEFLLFNQKKTTLFWAGLFIGLAFNFRATSLVVFILQIIIILFFSKIPNKFKSILALFLGALIPSIPSLIFFFKGPWVFFFNNFTYHQIWGKEVVEMGILQKFVVLGKFIFYPQNFLLIVLAVFGIWWSFKNNFKLGKIPLTFAMTLVIIYFLATPTQFQYYEQSLPYILTLSAFGLSAILNWLNHEKPRLKLLFNWGSSIYYVLTLIPFFLIFILAIRERDQFFKISEVKKVVSIIQESTTPEEKILSVWPGYLVFSKREGIEGMKTCGYEVTPFLDGDEVKSLNLVQQSEIERILKEKKAKLVVIWESGLEEFYPVIEKNYQLKTKIGKVSIYQ